MRISFSLLSVQLRWGRLKLGWSLLNQEFPRLCHVGIIGFSGGEDGAEWDMI